MITYKAMYKFLPDGVHAQVLDFPGVISCGHDLAESRHLLASALVDMAGTALQLGEGLPRPDASVTDPEAVIEEPIHWIRKAA